MIISKLKQCKKEFEITVRIWIKFKLFVAAYSISQLRMGCNDVTASSCCCMWFIVQLSFLFYKLFIFVLFVLFKTNGCMKSEYNEIGTSLRK